MNITDLLGAMVQSGMSPSTSDRLKNTFGAGSGGGGLLESLSGMSGGQGQSRGGLGDLLGNVLGGSGSGGGLGGILGSVLGEAGRAVGGKQNLALGGLGALAGALLGGGGKSVGGAMGGGVMALLVFCFRRNWSFPLDVLAATERRKTPCLRSAVISVPRKRLAF